MKGVARMRTIAIGDIHGCAKAVHALVQAIRPQREDTLVFLGDYIDRGPDSREQSTSYLPFQGGVVRSS